MKRAQIFFFSSKRILSNWWQLTYTHACALTDTKYATYTWQVRIAKFFALWNGINCQVFVVLSMFSYEMFCCRHFFLSRMEMFDTVIVYAFALRALTQSPHFMWLVVVVHFHIKNITLLSWKYAIMSRNIAPSYLCAHFYSGTACNFPNLSIK